MRYDRRHGGDVRVDGGCIDPFLHISLRNHLGYCRYTVFIQQILAMDGTNALALFNLAATHPDDRGLANGPVALSCERSPSSGSKKILVVDDNVDSALALAMLLQCEGFDTCVAHNGIDALRLAQEMKPDAALLDIGLPGMDGYQLVRRLHEQLDPIQLLCVAISGYGQAEDRARSAEYGFTHHLVKPVRYEELLQLLNDRFSDRTVGSSASPLG